MQVSRPYEHSDITAVAGGTIVVFKYSRALLTRTAGLTHGLQTQMVTRPRKSVSLVRWSRVRAQGAVGAVGPGGVACVNTPCCRATAVCKCHPSFIIIKTRHLGF